jgi:3-oxoacyl-[acyl-carrier protein] reductase
LLRDRTIVVTGATGGLGRAIAQICAREGASLGLHCRRDPEKAAALAAQLEAEFGTRARVLQFDVTDPDAIEQALRRFAEELGAIHGFVNNAALVKPGLLVTSELAQLREQLDTNLLGPLLCARAVLPIMMRARGGVLLQVSSVAAVQPVRGQAAYAASKGGVEALTRALAAEYARKGIRVLCLRPGPTATDMLAPTAALAGDAVHARTALARVARPEEVAEMAAFLLSDRAAYATGSVVAVDGGWGLQ